MKRVYVAGAYSADNVISILDNMRKGMRLSTEVLLAGFAPYCPWLDHHYILMLKENESLIVEDFYKYCLAWLEVSDAMILVSGWEGSLGTIAEIDKAEELDIPVFETMHELLEWKDE